MFLVWVSGFSDGISGILMLSRVNITKLPKVKILTMGVDYF